MFWMRFRWVRDVTVVAVTQIFFGGFCQPTLADFVGGQRVPNTPYTFAPPIFSGGLYNNGGLFQPSDPFFNFFPITAEPVPGAPNLLAVARQWAGVDLVDVHTGGTTKLLQLPVAPYPYFAPMYNQVTLPGTSTPRQGELYVFNESGVLGLAFHPNYAGQVGLPGHGKFYVNVTVDDPTRFIPGIDPTDGIQDFEVTMMNSPGPANDALKQCFQCEIANQTPIAGQAGGNFTVYCNTPALPKVDAARPTFMEVREYTVNNGAVVTDPMSGIPTYDTILKFQRERDYHNAGTLAFGPDGNLYISSGDSKGSPSQAFTHPEDPDADFFGKILRIDVDGPDAYPADPSRNYAIPADNPFKSGPLATMNPADDEVYAYGMRNPWRISFDSANGDLWIGDVGYNHAEEVNLVPAGTGGQNFGWPYFEGTAETVEHVADGRPLSVPPGGPPPANTVPPEYFYATTSINRGSITGGFVYRGPDTTLQGKYLYYDVVRRQVWSYDPASDMAEQITHKVFDDDDNNKIADDDNGNLKPEITTNGVLADIGLLPSFAQDSVGNLFLLSHSDGHIFRLRTADVNYDGALNAQDIDLLAAEARKPSGRSLLFDLNSDGVVNFIGSPGQPGDGEYLIRTVLKTEFGDADLDSGRDVDFSDFALLGRGFNGLGTGWTFGDFDGSGGATDFLDFALFGRFWGHDGTPGSGAAILAIPEPTAIGLAFLAMIGVCISPRRTAKRF